MKPMFFLFVCVSTTLTWADEADDRTAIEAVIRSLNEPKSASSLFASGENLAELDHLRNLPGFLDSQAPMSEVSRPQIVSKTIRFLDSRFAAVDGAKAQYGSLRTRSIPVFFLMERQGKDWRIAFLRVTGERPLGMASEAFPDFQN